MGLDIGYENHQQQSQPGANRASQSGMTTKLDKALKREIVVDDRPYTVTLTAEGVKVVEKGKRNGHELTWRSIVSGDTQLAEALNISVDATRQNE